MRYIVNLKSEQINGVTYWSGGVAPVRQLPGRPDRALAISESVLTEQKNNITGEITRRLRNEDFITNEVTHGNVRVGSVEELIDRLNQVQ